MRKMSRLISTSCPLPRAIRRHKLKTVFCVAFLLSLGIVVGNLLFTRPIIFSKSGIVLHRNILDQIKPTGSGITTTPRLKDETITPTFQEEQSNLRRITEVISQNNMQNLELSDASKSPVEHVVFLKVHKTASSTSQSIFLRFGWKRNLTFVLAPEFNNSGWPNVISYFESVTDKNTVPAPVNKTFDILCNHLVYNSTAIRKIMPNDAVYVGSVRQPFSWFKSMMNYFKLGYVLKVSANDSTSLFLRNPLRYEPTAGKGIPFSNNRMSFEFGYPPAQIRARNFVGFRKYLENIDKEFKLVLVAERYVESVVLMKRYLRWELQDIVFLKKNSKSIYKIVVKDSDEAFYQHHARFDYILYDFFSERLDDQIRAEGPSFPKEVEQFELIQDRVQDFCSNGVKIKNVTTVDASDWNKSFNVTAEDCIFMKRGEIDFIQRIRKRQYGIEPTWKWKK